MTNYTIKILIKDEEDINIDVSYEREYELKSHIVNLGSKGVLQEDDKKNLIYTPPHKVDKIIVSIKK